MKRLISFVLAAMMLCTGMVYASASGARPAAVGATETLTARVSKMEILLDGERVRPSGYLIGNYTYFKLRDIAYLMQSKECKFNVAYDNAAQRISLTRSVAYEAKGGELDAVGSSDQKAEASALAVLIDDKAVSMQAYNIKGFTYYKLRDIGENLGFVVDYKNDSKQGILKTPGYTEPAPEPEPPQPETPTEPQPSDPVEPAPPQSPDPKAHLDGVLTVLIDVGHGGSDSGSTGIAPVDYVDYKGRQLKAGSKILEKDFNLPVSLYLRDMLAASGVEVIMTRESDVTVSFAKRKELIEQNAEKADLCFSVHHNAYNTKAMGFELLAQIQYKDGGAGKELGAVLEKYYTATGRTRHRPTVFREGQNGDYYAILRYAADVGMLATISEYVFIDNQEDVRCILSDDGLRAEAQAIHDGIMEYFSNTPY